MKQRTALILAAGITAFLMVAGGAIVSVLANAGTTDASEPMPLVEAPVQPTATTDVTTPIAAQREAQYRQLIEQANQRIQQANAEIQTLKAQVQQARAQQAQASQSQYAFPANVAGEFALQLVQGASLLRQPELVNYQGTAAYEVVLDAGTLYLDANTGKVVGAVAANSAPSSGQDDREGREQEGGDDH